MINKFMPNIFLCKYIDIEDFKDKVFTSIMVIKDSPYEWDDGRWPSSDVSDLILFIDENRDAFLMFYHLMHYTHRNCCIEVYIEDICGDIQGLVGSPILLAEESFQEEYAYNGTSTKEACQEGKTNNGTSTWTFYKFSTEEESVTIRWNFICKGRSSRASLLKLDKSINQEYIDALLESVK